MSSATPELNVVGDTAVPEDRDELRRCFEECTFSQENCYAL
jgi:hypothetical protein